MVAPYPSLQGAERQLVLVGDDREWLSPFQDRSHHIEALHRLRSFAFRQLGQRQQFPLLA